MNRKPSEPYELVRIAVMLGTLISLVTICIYLVVKAFQIDSAAGIRSTAAILLPLVVGGFLAVFKRELFARASAIRPSIAFILAVGFAVVMMLLIRNVAAFQFAPVAELIVAGGLTILLYAPGSMPGIVQETEKSDVWMAYYFGVVSGMLGYIVLIGFPFAGAV